MIHSGDKFTVPDGFCKQPFISNGDSVIAKTFRCATTPVVPKRVDRPCFWLLRKLLMPCPGVESLVRFILDLIKFAVELHHLPVGVEMIRENTVANDVTPRTPHHMVVVP